MRLCIIGCGSIGSYLAKELENLSDVELVYITDKSEECIARLEQRLRKVRYAHDIVPVLREVALVVEAASQDAALYYTPIVLGAGASILIMSVGAFRNDEFREGCYRLAKRKHAKIFIPSGALAGIDALDAAHQDALAEVVLTSTKPPSAYIGVRWLEERGIDPMAISAPTVLFDGSAREATEHFPQNVNVAATVALVGVGFDRTHVRVVCDPQATANRHHLYVRGAFGEFEAETRNVPSPFNPKTSLLAALSALAAIQKVTREVWIGV